MSASVAVALSLRVAVAVVESTVRMRVCVCVYVRVWIVSLRMSLRMSLSLRMRMRMAVVVVVVLMVNRHLQRLTPPPRPPNRKTKPLRVRFAKDAGSERTDEVRDREGEGRLGFTAVFGEVFVGEERRRENRLRVSTYSFFSVEETEERRVRVRR